MRFEEQKRNISPPIRSLRRPFYKGLVKLLFKPIDAQELQDSEKVLTVWVKNLNKIVNKMNNTVLLIIGMKPIDAIKLETVPLDKTYPKETVLPKDVLYRYPYQSGEQHGDQKRRAIDVETSGGI